MIPGIVAGQMPPPCASGDPYWANVVCLLHFDGANGSSVFTDSSPKARTFTRYGTGASISTEASMFGGASLSTVTDGIYAADSEDFNFGTGDFTVELFYRAEATTNWFYYGLIGQCKSTSTNNGWKIITNNTAPLRIVAQISTTGSGNTFSISGPAMETGRFYYVALVRRGTILELYVDAVLVGTATIGTAAVFNSTRQLEIGRWGNGLVNNSFFDEVRITKGVARDISTIPTAPFPNN